MERRQSQQGTQSAPLIFDVASSTFGHVRPFLELSPHSLFQSNSHPSTGNQVCESSQLLNQSLGYENALCNMAKLTKDVANQMFKPIFLDSSPFTLPEQFSDPTQLMNSTDSACQLLQSIPLTRQPCLYPLTHLLVQPQMIQNPASIHTDQIQHQMTLQPFVLPLFFLPNQPQRISLPGSICIQRFPQMTMMIPSNQGVGIRNHRDIPEFISPSASSSSESTQSVRIRDVNIVMKPQQVSESLPHVRSVTSRSLDLSDMYHVSIIGLKDNIVRRWKSHYDDEPDMFEKERGERYEQFDFDYKMSREFAEKRFFEIYGCNFCLGRNQLIHHTNKCRVLSSTQKCHQLAAANFCFKCIRPNHRTKDCKHFPEGCSICRDPRHSKWTHTLMIELQAVWGISSQEEALQKCHTEGEDYADHRFQY